MSRPVISITFPNHWSIKNLMHGGVIAELEKSADIQGWASADRIPHLIRLCAELGLRPIEWVATPDYLEPKNVTLVRLLQKCLLFERHQISTERILQASSRGNRSAIQRVVSRCLRVVSKTPLFSAVYKSLSQAREKVTPPCPTPFPRIPDLFFATNPVDFREDSLVKAARQAGVPVVTMVPSWDNLTSKGVLFGKFERVFVWNAVMGDEVRRLYPDVQPSQITAVGIARFQTYEEAAPVGKFHLDPSKKVVLFANTATKSFPDQPCVVRHLAEAVQCGEIPNAQLVVRCHPHDRVSDYEEFSTMDSVSVWPDVELASAQFGVETVPAADDLTTLHAMLSRADVCVNAASTIVLDAAACDLPIISVAYDGNRTLDYAESVRSFYDYSHQVPYIQSHAGDFANSRTELIDAVNHALQHRSEKTEQRAALLSLATTGRPASKLAIGLLDMVSASKEIRRAA